MSFDCDDGALQKLAERASILAAPVTIALLYLLVSRLLRDHSMHFITMLL